MVLRLVDDSVAILMGRAGELSLLKELNFHISLSPIDSCQMPSICGSPNHKCLYQQQQKMERHGSHVGVTSNTFLLVAGGLHLVPTYDVSENPTSNIQRSAHLSTIKGQTTISMEIIQ